MVKMEQRPTTATLIKPAILDSRLLGIFDMTTVSREHLLAIKNLVHSTPRCKCKLMLKAFTSDREPIKPNDANAKIQKVYKALNKTYRLHRYNAARPRLNELPPKDEPVSKIPAPKIPAVIPVPCATCGRQDQPERFHSHPSRSDVKVKEVKPIKESEERKTVQKPVPIKFRSAKTKPNESKELSKSEVKRTSPAPSKPKEQKSSKGVDVHEKAVTHDKENVKIKAKWREVAQKTVPVQPNKTEVKTPNYEAYKLDSWVPAPISGGRKRKVVCYLCSQEFGTAALPSHEAQCIRKYLKESSVDNAAKDENISLEHLNERPPSQALENWKLAWELTQTSLIACLYCGRKFLPNRVDAHQKICSSKSDKNKCSKSSSNVNMSQTTSLQSSTSLQCEHCNKWFTGLTIAQHRDEIEKSRKSDDALSKNLLLSFTAPSTSPDTDVLCYICGRNFESKTVRSHEQQCLRKWLLQHEKLPLNILHTIPTIGNESELISSVNNAEGINGFDGYSQEIFWEVHQAQLVPCLKCGRTFYPHRLEVHVKGCKGSIKHKIKSVCDRVKVAP